MSTAVKVDICQLPHGKGLALPAYQSIHAAGLDLLAAVPEDTPIMLAPGKHGLIPTGLTIALPPGYEAQVRLVVRRLRNGNARNPTFLHQLLEKCVTRPPRRILQVRPLPFGPCCNIFMRNEKL